MLSTMAQQLPKASLAHLFASLPRTQRGQFTQLSVDPHGKKLLYCNNNTVFIRDIENPNVAEQYTEHTAPTTVARCSPLGNFVLSADNLGKVRVWVFDQPEHLLKYEYQHFAGAVKDLAWSPDGQRAVVVGEGKQKFAHAFLVDTGSAVGEVSGHSKSINAVDYRPTRPFRIVTAGEDTNVHIYEGPPFKMLKQIDEHKNFVNCVRYSPDGKFFVSGGADGKAVLYDGTTGVKVGDFGEPAHSGGIYGVGVSPDNKKVVTASADRTLKVWNLEDRSLIGELSLGANVDDQQLGCVWATANTIISLSLSGSLNYIDASTNQLRRSLTGHAKPIMSAIVYSRADGSKAVVTAAADSRVCVWDTAAPFGSAQIVTGHKSQISRIAICDNVLFSVGQDDQLIASSLTELVALSAHKLDKQPRSVVARRIAGKLQVFVACCDRIETLLFDEAAKSFTKLNTLSVDKQYEAFCAAYEPTHKHLAVGATDKNSAYIYAVDDSGKLSEVKSFVPHSESTVTDLQYSPDGQHLAVGLSGRRVFVYDATKEYARLDQVEWIFHSAKVLSVAWHPDGVHLASGSVDSNVELYSLRTPRSHVKLDRAHPQSPVTAVGFLDNNRLFSVAFDACVRIWNYDDVNKF